MPPKNVNRKKKLTARHSEEWVHKAIIYEIFFRSFTPEGTIQSAVKKLPMLRSLGVNVLWLMPVHPIGKVGRKGALGSPYAVKDYYKVNPEYGTLDDLKKFIQEAHRRGLHVIMDLVLGHAAWDNPQILLYTEWFKKKNGEIISPLPEWSDVAWFNYRKKKLRRYMINVMKFWIGEVGFDGFRCDVADRVPLSFWEEARAALDKIKPLVMLSESDHSPSHHRKAFDLSYSTPFYKTLVSVLQGKANVEKIKTILTNEHKRYLKGSLLLRFTSNHDRNVEDGADVSVFGQRPRRGEKGTMLAAVAANTVPGVPMLYNGQEFGSTKQLSLFEKTTLPKSENKNFLRFYQKLFALRKKHAALIHGKIIFLPTSQSKSIVAFARVAKKATIIVLMNCSKKTGKFSVSFLPFIGVAENSVQCRDLFEGKNFKIQLDDKKLAEFELTGFGWKIVQVKSPTHL